MDELLIIIGLILLNGLFSMSEAALISVRKPRLEQESRRGNKAAKTALEIADDPDRFLSTIQIGITLIGILTGLYSGATISATFADILADWGVSPRYARPVAQTSIVVIVTYLSIVVGELVPKRIALAASNSVAKIVARPMRLLSLAAMPFVWLLSVSTGVLVRLLRLPADENRVTEGDVRQIIDSGAASGEVMPVEKDIMTRALVLGDQRVSSVMTSRKDVVAFNIGMTADEIKEELAAELHDSYPVFDSEREEVRGVVSLKDLILTLDKPGFQLERVMTPGVFIPESMTVYGALERLKAERVHCFVVCDEFGSMQGVITLNDILDGLVGGCDSSVTEPYIVAAPDGGVIVNAQCPVYDFLNYFDEASLYQPANYVTVGGLILELTRQLPSVGERVGWHGFMFEVTKMNQSHIGELRVHRIPREEETEE
ncbi:MAG: HlyC/CorC family transporter [Muribaculaceae bacterium]|jgi:putative hemolysin|nr:HlyC/CorC family transporter [Muribaculaceae bacterium]